MTFEEALRAELTTILELNNKIFPLNAIEGIEEPYLVYVSSEGKFDKDLDGFQNSKEVECELNILDSTYEGMKDLAKEVISKLIKFENRQIGTSGPYIQEIVLETHSPELYENRVNLYRKIINMRVFFEEV